MAANVAAQLAGQQAAAMQAEEERGRRRARERSDTITKEQMQATRDASVMLGHTINNFSNHRRHQRSLSVMSDYFDAIGEDQHIENDEHNYEYASIFSALASSKRNSSIGQAMRDWHTRTSESSERCGNHNHRGRIPSPSPLLSHSPSEHITFIPASPSSHQATTESSEIAQAMKQWHSRTRLKRRHTGRGMDIMAQTLDWGEWEGVLGKALGIVAEGWEESVLAFVLLVVMFRLWLLDAFGGRI